MSEKIMYVIFDKETGSILGIKATEYTGENSIPVPLDKVRKLISGEDSTTAFEVRYNTKIKQMEFGSRYDTQMRGNSVNDFIYDVPQGVGKSPDILIVQDVVNTCWKVHIGAVLGDSLRRKGVTVNDRMMLSVTAKGDPNILYKTLFVELADVVRDNYVVLPFTMPFEHSDEPISIFTSRKFDTYQFKRIFNEQ
jgi:hypothetical protein